MGRTAPLKKKGAASVHSRAAKRASSPSIDIDKSFTNVKPPVESRILRPSVLAIHQGAGVSKRSKNGRKSILSAKAKRRQEKGLDRAEAVMDKKEKKVERSKGKARTVQERSKAWDELNKRLLAKKTREETLQRESLADEASDGVEPADEVMVEDVPAAETVDVEAAVESVPLPALTDEEDEIL